MCVHLCDCKFDGLILWSVKILKHWDDVYSKGGVCNWLILSLQTTCAAAITSYREVTLNYGAFDPWWSKQWLRTLHQHLT